MPARSQKSNPPPRESTASASRAKVQAAWLTNVTKVVGLALAINEGLIRDEARLEVLIAGMAFVLGLQAVENVLLRAIDRFFARE